MCIERNVVGLIELGHTHTHTHIYTRTHTHCNRSETITKDLFEEDNFFCQMNSQPWRRNLFLLINQKKKKKEKINFDFFLFRSMSLAYHTRICKHFYV